MAGKQIIWSTLAQEELLAILEFYALQNGNSNYSIKLLGEIEDLASTISRNELIGRLCSNKFTRMIPILSYIIFYEINYEKIEIISIWDNRQDPGKRKVK